MSVNKEVLERIMTAKERRVNKDNNMNELLLFSKTSAYLNDELCPSDLIEAVKDYLYEWNRVALDKVGNILFNVEEGKLVSKVTYTNKVLEEDISLNMQYINSLREYITQLDKEIEEYNIKYPNIPENADREFIDKLELVSEKLFVSVNSLYAYLLLPLVNNEDIKDLVNFVKNASLDELIEIVSNNIVYQCIQKPNNYNKDNNNNIYWLSFKRNKCILTIRRKINLKGKDYFIEDYYFVDMNTCKIQHSNDYIKLRTNEITFTIENNDDFEELINEGNIITNDNLGMSLVELENKYKEYDLKLIERLDKIKHVINYVNDYTEYTLFKNNYNETNFKYYKDENGVYSLDCVLLFNKIKINFPNEYSDKFKIKLYSNCTNSVTLSTYKYDTLVEYHKFLFKMGINYFHISDTSKLLVEVSNLKTMEQYKEEDDELLDFPIKDCTLYIDGNVQLKPNGRKELELLILNENSEILFNKYIDLTPFDAFVESMHILNK